jgi:hypothetical protein
VYGFGDDSTGTKNIQFPQGPDYANNQLNVYVQIVDNDSGVTVNKFATVIVTQDTAFYGMTVQNILSSNPSSSIMQTLQGGTTQAVLSIVQSIATQQNSLIFSVANSQSCMYFLYKSLNLIQLIVLFNTNITQIKLARLNCFHLSPRKDTVASATAVL